MKINYIEEYQKSKSQYDYCKLQLNSIVSELKDYDRIQAIGSRKVGMHKFIKNLLPSFDTLSSLSESDSVSSFLTINRMIIDNYSIYYLLTSHSTIQERNIRYYLYLIDGIKTRTKVVKDFQSKMSKNIADMSNDERESVFAADVKSIQQLEELLNKENTGNFVSSKIIESSNWKFIDSKSNKSFKKNSYSWIKLYNLARIPEKYSHSFQNYHSSFVHGLGITLMSNTKYDKMPIVCSSLYLTSIIQTLIIKILLTEYENELKLMEINSDFKKVIESNWEIWKTTQHER